ncbi:MAG: glutamyl-tRNA amidotransferase [Rhodothermaeota bacterium MED-G16]|nr:MAG: glutamyl-tRNA amidotransferase [Rhodothermaeota bacterium MED-G16]
MNLKNTIDNQIKEAMLSKSKERLTPLRAIKAAILLEEKNGLSDNVNEVQLLMKLIKQRKDSLTLYKEQKREDLASKEESEILIIEEFLPKQLSDGELSDKIEKIINESGASSIKEMGKVMGIATKKLSGKADNSRIAKIIKEKLN